MWTSIVYDEVGLIIFVDQIRGWISIYKLDFLSITPNIEVSDTVINSACNF